MCSLPYEDGLFDAITAFETVYFWSPVKTALAEVARVLRKGGCFLISLEAGDPEGIWEALRGKLFREENGKPVSPAANYVYCKVKTLNKTADVVKGNVKPEVSHARVSNDNAGSAVSAAVDTVSDYVQGPIKTTSFSKSPYEISVEDSITGKSRTYAIADNAIARYDGETTAAVSAG